MAIQTKFKLTENVEIDSYVKIESIFTFKVSEEIKLKYNVEYLTEKNGIKLKQEDYFIDYNGNNVWNEFGSKIKI